jgi:hypothetical protein
VYITDVSAACSRGEQEEEGKEEKEKKSYGDGGSAWVR